MTGKETVFPGCNGNEFVSQTEEKEEDAFALPSRVQRTQKFPTEDLKTGYLLGKTFTNHTILRDGFQEVKLTVRISVLLPVSTYSKYIFKNQNARPIFKVFFEIMIID